MLILLYLLLFPQRGWAQNPCRRGQSRMQLATVAVWVKHNGSLTTFRISDEDLLDEGFQRSPADRDLIPVQLAREPGSCPVGLCALRLSASIRKKDGIFLQQEDIYALPEDFTQLNDDFYCGRAMGDCGADVPIYRLSMGKGIDAIPAYSMDPTGAISGFTRDPRPICYGWSSGNIGHGALAGEGCPKLGSVANAQIFYSARETASFAIGTTASLQCSSGFLASGATSALCTNSGWNPFQLGSCNRSNSLMILSTGSSLRSTACTAAATVKNGQIIYSQLELGGRLPSGTTATVLCFLGFVATSTNSPKCDNGNWIGQWPSCLPLDRVQCQPFSVQKGAMLVYEPKDDPLAIGSTVTIECSIGYAAAGAVRSTCGKNGWQPKALGICVTRTRVKRQGFPCFPPAVFNGNVSYIQANSQTLYSAGTSAIIACNVGYVIQGSVSSICQNGQWTPSLGTCQSSGVTPPFGGINSGSSGAQCFDLPAPLSGTISYSQPASALSMHPSTTIATLNCNFGTTVSGSLTSTCSNGAWSPATLGSCSGSGGVSNSLLECSNPTVINGQISYSMSSPSEPVKPVGTTATLFCNLGFTASGSTSSTCQSGQWIPQLGSCQSGSGGISGNQQCFGGILPPFGATITYSNGAAFGPYPAGTVASLKCTGGVIPTGTAEATCMAGQWQPSTLGSCSSTAVTPPFNSGATCPAIFLPAGGSLTYSQASSFGSYPSGTLANLICTTGSPSGSITSTCQNGIWSPTIGMCGGIGIGTGGTQCYSIIPPMGTSISYSMSGPFGPFNQGTTASISCMDRSQSLVGSSISTCQNGQWQPNPSTTNCAPNAGNTQCSAAPTTPLGGTLSYSNSQNFPPFTANTVATLTCSSGFVQGQSSAICLNGQWSGQLGTCSGSSGGISCPSGVITPLGATITYSNGSPFGPYPAGTVATMNCGGSFVTGSSTTTCSNGQWTQLGSCGGGSTSGSSCTSSISVPFGATVSYSNGAIFGPFPAGTIASLRCSTTTTADQSTVTCSNGQWLPPSFTSCSSTGGSSCTPLTTPLGGNIIYSSPSSFSYPVGTTATLQCSGRTISGSPSTSCFNGNWQPALGTCGGSTNNQQCLFAPTTPSGGSLTFSTGSSFGPWQQGTTVTVTCSLGQYPQGTSTATCMNGAWGALATSCGSSPFGGSGSIGGGTGISCSAQITPLNGNITYNQGGAFGPYPTGTSSFLTCSPGYTTQGSSSSQCNNGQWNPTIGSCTYSGGSVGGTQCYTGITISSGTVTYSNGQYYGPWPAGTVANLNCIGGFPTGASSATCSNGFWSPSQLGSCSGGGSSSLNSCQAIPVIPSGTLTYSQFGLPPYAEGTTVTLVCNFGTSLAGQGTVTCRSGGWTPFPGLGSCQSPLHSPPRLLESNLLNSTDSCPPPKAPPFGEITYSSPEEANNYPEGTTAALRCTQNYGKKGATFATCRSGAFRPLLGSCEKEGVSLAGVCLPLQAPQNGRVSYIQASLTTALEAGSTALLDCEDGYAISGRATLSCSTEGSWTPEDGFGMCEKTTR